MYGFGLIATCLGIAGAIPYIRNSYRRKTKPHRYAWLIFLILSIIAFSSQFALGARASLIFYGWFVVNNATLVTLSLRKGAGYGDITPWNVISLCLAVLAITLWKTTSSALVALICTLAADGIGALLILVKAYRHPETETLAMWMIGILASCLNVLAVGKLDGAILAAPVQVFLFDVAIASAILLGRRVRPRSKQQLGKAASGA